MYPPLILTDEMAGLGPAIRSLYIACFFYAGEG